MIAVYQRCLANYQSKQWDLGTHVLFNSTLREELQVPVPAPACIPIPGYACLGDCVLEAKAQGSTPAPCLGLYLQTLSTTDLDYFEYAPTTSTASSQIDACQVFTGPAQLPEGGYYRACLNEYSNTADCQLPLMVWSGRSSNKVPVATSHGTVISDEAKKIEAAQRIYRETRDQIKALLERLNKTWSADGLEIEVFSAEGDLLHQMFDCILLGPLGKVNMWPSGPIMRSPIYSRRTDGSDSREFELPCSGDLLKDRLGLKDTQVRLLYLLNTLAGASGM